jgi:hypothetical protein
MEEQRMLDEMERQLAIDDPKLASRLNAFSGQRMTGAFTSHRARTISGLLALALIAAVTIMMFVLSPYSARGNTSHPGSTHGKTAPAAQSQNSSG